MNFLKLCNFKLSANSHETPEEGLCIMEAVAWFMGEEHSDNPECADEAIGSFAIGVNDTLRDEARGELIPYIPLIAGSKDSEEIFWQRAQFICDKFLVFFNRNNLEYAKVIFEEEVPYISARNLQPFSSWLVKCQPHRKLFAREASQVVEDMLVCLEIDSGQNSINPVLTVMGCLLTTLDLEGKYYFEVLDEALSMGNNGALLKKKKVKAKVAEYHDLLAKEKSHGTLEISHTR